MNYATKRLYAAAQAVLPILEGDELGTGEAGERIEELTSALHYFDAHGATQPDEDGERETYLLSFNIRRR